MAEEVKDPKAALPAPAQVKPEEKKEEVKVQEPSKPSGLEGKTVDELKELYKKSPQMFEEAGIVQKKEEPKETPKEEPKPPPEKPQSAAPVVMDGTEIKLPEDVPVEKEVVAGYIAHAKEIGLSPKQVQAEIDFQAKQYREAVKRQAQQKTPEQIQQEADAANVAKLKTEFGAQYDENMETARRAAMKYADPELLERLKTSDPVLVRHLLKLGKADAEDTTRGAPNRTGSEEENEEAKQQSYLKRRYPNSPTMFPEKGTAG
jgi:hypothetical protein